MNDMFDLTHKLYSFFIRNPDLNPPVSKTELIKSCNETMMIMRKQEACIYNLQNRCDEKDRQIKHWQDLYLKERER